MENESNTPIWMLFGIVALGLIFKNKANAQPILSENYKFVAKRNGVPAYLSPNKNGQWIPDFSRVSTTFQAGVTISTVWLGEITLVTPEGVKTSFYILELQTPQLGLTFPIAVKMDDVNRYVI